MPSARSVSTRRRSERLIDQQRAKKRLAVDCQTTAAPELPAEVIALIISLATKQATEICLNMQLVSRQWRAACKLEAAWLFSELDFNYAEDQFQKCIKHKGYRIEWQNLFRCVPKLRKLLDVWLPQLDTRMIKYASNMLTELTYLDMYTSIHLRMQSNIVFNKVQTVHMEIIDHSTGRVKHVVDLASMSSTFPSLTEISTWWLPAVSYTNVASLAQCSNLRKLRISVAINPVGLEACTQLTDLSLEFFTGDEVSSLDVKNLLLPFHGLTSLDMAVSDFNNVNLSWFRYMTCLERLEINNVDLREEPNTGDEVSYLFTLKRFDIGVR